MLTSSLMAAFSGRARFPKGPALRSSSIVNGVRIGGNVLLKRLGIERRIDFGLREPERDVRRGPGRARPKVAPWRAAPF